MIPAVILPALFLVFHLWSVQFQAVPNYFLFYSGPCGGLCGPCGGLCVLCGPCCGPCGGPCGGLCGPCGGLCGPCGGLSFDASRFQVCLHRLNRLTGPIIFWIFLLVDIQQ